MQQTKSICARVVAINAPTNRGVVLYELPGTEKIKDADLFVAHQSV